MNSDIVQQLVDLGAPPDVIQEARGKSEAPPVRREFGVWQENWIAVMLFRNLGTQWNVVAGMGGAFYTGLKYEVVEGQMRRLRIPQKKWPDYWDDLYVMEAAALPLLNKSMSS